MSKRIVGLVDEVVVGGVVVVGVEDDVDKNGSTEEPSECNGGKKVRAVQSIVLSYLNIFFFFAFVKELLLLLQLFSTKYFTIPVKDVTVHPTSIEAIASTTLSLQELSFGSSST